MRKLCAKRTESESGAWSESELDSVSRKLSEPKRKKKKIETRGRGGVRQGSLLPMPSVRGMRRSTRVFGVVKGVDGARVLRSGRRLWPDSDNGKIGKGNNDGDDWYKLIDNYGGGGLNSKENKWHEVGSKRAVAAKEVKAPQRAQTAMPKSKKSAPRRSSVRRNDNGNVDKKYGAVYSRKRKRLGDKRSDFSENKTSPDDRMYGIHFVRRKRRTGSGESPVQRRPMLVVAVESSSCSNACCFSGFLYSVLRYMKRARVRLSELSALVFSETFTSAFSSCGIRFFRDLPCSSSSGICKIFGARQFTPFFAVDFSALPLCFMLMHSTMLLQSERMVSVFLYSLNMHADDETLSDSEDDLSCMSIKGELPDSEFIASGDDNSLNGKVLQQTVGAPKLGRRNALCRIGLNSRSIRGKRRSLRSRRARKPSVGVNKSFKGSFSSDFFSFRNEFVPLSSSVSSRGVQGLVESSLVENIKEVKSTVVGLREDLDSTCCSANILVIESDRCYREEGANILLELSPSDQWFLVVKRDGLTRYSHKAEKVMRPCGSNRVTHAIIWTAEDGWKLEFPNRGDWFIFKELYKECSVRNLPDADDVKFIPIPGVLEVSGYGDSYAAPFLRPESYISLNGDEVSRALAKRTSNYDMDSEDEAWLNKFNNKACAENELYENVSEENFELMLDAFEKSFFCSPDDYSDEKATTSLCLDLGRREVVQAVYNYWTKKRKQKHSALVRVFQGHQPRKSQLTESVLRKKRSFKRQASQSGRGKQRFILQAMAAQQYAFDEKNARLKVEEAEVAANKSAEVAVVKRKRAQLLMETADLAAYKATMSYRIAEAARITGSSDAAAAKFLD